MRSVNTKTHKQVWESKFVDCTWTKSKKLDNGQRKLVQINTDKDIELTLDDLKYFPTQKDLETYTFRAKPEVYEKLYKPFYTIRHVNKDKVTSTELKLKLIEA